MDARRWLGRSVLVLGGVALLVVAHSDNKYRGLEAFAGAVLLVLGGISGAIDLLLIFAAKTVKPRKLGND